MEKSILSNIEKVNGLNANFMYCYKVGKKTVKIEPICPVSANKTKKIDILCAMIKFAVADYKAQQSDKVLFENVGEPLFSVLKGKLNCTVLFRTDENGKAVTFIESEIPFTQTALKIKDSHTVLNASKKNLKAAIYQHAKVVESQMLAYSKVYTLSEAMDKELEEAEKEAEKEAKKEAKTV